ncbi:MAG TPA: plastocyanin/azurin family copper-binding protein [Solirubrobacterales bacterium]|nr:plastocyanin/azurin family copper-binding protein [Solirubrobacterales bacterium]
MSDETVFYILGIALAVSAVVLTFAGLKLKNFPGRAFPVIVLWFVVLVGGATTYSVLQAKEHEEAHAAELHEAGEHIEEAEEQPHEEEGGAPGGEPEEAEEGATTLQLAADPAAIAFDTTELSAKPGKVTIDFDNPSAIPHNAVIEKDGEEIAGTAVISESSESVSAELEAGTYTFLCTVPGHAQAGMEGTLTVE